jgi:thymidine phosphorylase
MPQEVIRRKRDRHELTPAEIAAFVKGVTDGSVSEGQIGAFTMSIYLNGTTTAERVALALAMRDRARCSTGRRPASTREPSLTSTRPAASATRR